MAMLPASFDEAALLLRLVDLVLLVSLLELAWLLLRRPATTRGLLPNLLAGLSLCLALRLSLGGAGLAWIAPCLMAAGVAHLLDLQARRRSVEQISTPTHAPGQGRPSP